MTHILIGENSSGKTKTLYDKIQGLPVQRVVTNLEEYRGVPNNLNQARVYLWVTHTDREVSVGVDFVLIEGVPPEVCSVISDFLREGDYLVYDEPDMCNVWRWADYIYEALFCVSHTYKECWIASHHPSALIGADSVIYSCDSSTVVSKKEAYEILNTI